MLLPPEEKIKTVPKNENFEMATSTSEQNQTHSALSTNLFG